MAQWNHSERTLTAKLVYYGPALGGKTTNLQAIHRITDPAGASPLVSLKTAGDRTLFFDLMAFDLGELFGYRIGLQLYTVPGQVAYNSTRKIVLTGADGVAFIADSTPGREKDNRVALENLRANLRATGTNPDTVPVVVQYNKRDLPGALAPAAIEKHLQSGSKGIQAEALMGEGVIETLQLLCQETLARLAESLKGNGAGIERSALDARVATVLAPFLLARGETPAAPGVGPFPGVARVAAQSAFQAPTVNDDDLLKRSLDENLRMARDYVDVAGMKARLASQVSELERLHTLVSEVARTRDPGRMVERLAEAAANLPGVAGASVLERGAPEDPIRLRAIRGMKADPAQEIETAGDTLARRLMDAGAPVVAADLAADLPGTESHPCFAGIGSLLSLPLAGREHPALLLIVYGAGDRPAPLGKDEMRYLSLLGLQISTCLDNGMLYARLANYSEQLESEVRLRTAELRKAYGELQEVDAMKDRFLSNISHEMRTPLTTILASADLLASDAEAGGPQAEFAGMIRDAAGLLARMVEDVIRLRVMQQGGGQPQREPLTLEPLVRQVVEEMGAEALARSVGLRFDPGAGTSGLRVAAEADLLRTAVRHLIGNALKFSPAGTDVMVGLEHAPGDGAGNACVLVSDRGPGIPAADRERVMGEFEQLGALLTNKPSGLGLGLPLVAAIAGRHGGTITLDPGDGGGTVARLLLPLAPETQAASESARTGAARQLAETRA